jgi:hypothetical protein
MAVKYEWLSKVQQGFEQNTDASPCCSRSLHELIHQLRVCFLLAQKQKGSQRSTSRLGVHIVLRIKFEAIYAEESLFQQHYGSWETGMITASPEASAINS